MISKLHFPTIVRHFMSGLAIILFAGSAFVSCTDDVDMPEYPSNVAYPESGYITLTLKCANNVSRAEEPGVESLNENKIQSVTLFMSPSAGDRNDDVAPVYRQTFTDLDVNNEAVLRIPLTSELVTRLFGENSSNTCRVFAAVNVDPGEAKTVNDLRALSINSDFAESQKQECFTMDGDGEITYSGPTYSAMGKITVQRSAAKITLALNVDEKIEEVVDGETLTWTPNLEGMLVRLQQGVQKSNLDPKPTLNMASDVYFNTPNDLQYDFKSVERPAGDKYEKYTQEQNIPFYTYPNKWTGDINERHGTFMMLSVPWTSDGGKSYRTCYYHVPITPTNVFELVRNHSYHVYLHVGVLGSFVPEEPFEIEGDYYVADWGKEDLEVDIKDYRYLVVDQSNYVVNNMESTSIPFYTSHETVVTNVKMTFYRYNFSDQGSEFAVEVSPAQNTRSEEDGDGPVYTCEFDNKNNNLLLSHSLNIWVPYNANGNEVNLTRKVNGTRADLDNAGEIQAVLNTIAYFKEKANDSEYSRIEYEVTVQHKDVNDGSSGIDKNLYKETVTITQYPGMYITAVQNYCENLGGGWTANANLGNTFINGNTNSSTGPWNSQIRFDQASPSNGDIPNELTLLNDDGTKTKTSTSDWNDQHKLVYQFTNWQRSIGLGSPKQGYYNWNPNLYLVTITQLNPDLGEIYKIDDPRSYNINNYLANDGAYQGYTVDGGSDRTRTTEYWYYRNGNTNLDATSNLTHFGGPNPRPSKYEYSSRWWCEYIISGWTSAPALYGTTPRTLQYYYPTMESDNNKMTIAPKFRICSSYAGSRANLTREMARMRAAAYQELGYCAGRWRLPTYGEVEYIMRLSADGKIPRLFGTNGSGTWCYWCAQGAVIVPDNTDYPYISDNPSNVGSTAVAPFTGNNYRARTRFVYDEWFWGEGTLTPSSATPNENSPTYTFTWGDRQKTNPEN